MSKILQDNSLPDLSKYNTVFCDSLQALEWAYKNGLPKSAIVKSSSPAMLCSKRKYIHNVEARWGIKDLKKFQSTIRKLTEDAFDLAINVVGVERELALVVSQSVYKFQNLIYKAACLEEEDFIEPRLFIRIGGKTGPAGNIMNSPWDGLLLSNTSFSTVDYTLQDDDWKVLTTQGISYWRRFKVSGFDTVIYRLAMKFMKYIPSRIFTREILIPNENELNIEITSSLVLNRVKITKIQLEPLSSNKDMFLDKNVREVYKAIYPIMQKRVEQWVVPSAIETTMALFKNHIEERFRQFYFFSDSWKKVIKRSSTVKKTVLVNSPSNIKGYALAYVCRKNNILLMSSQHGVTIEISKMHDILHIDFDNSVADVVFSYNHKIIEIEKNTYFNKSKYHAVGMPMRFMRMRAMQVMNNSTPSIVYISTNLYHMGLSLAQKTDYIKFKSEKNIVTKILSKLPHKVRYKTYPEDNRRYADIDPILNEVRKFDNIEIFDKKIDMRYLVSEHKVLITTCATSTLGWPVMSGKPVVFINQKYNNPLADEAYASISKGLFVFNDDESDFHEKLKNFLSQSIEEIERLWQERKDARKEMIREYFSVFDRGAGARSAKIILENYFK